MEDGKIKVAGESDMPPPPSNEYKIAGDNDMPPPPTDELRASPKSPAPSKTGGESGAFVRPITPSTPTSASGGSESASWTETAKPVFGGVAAKPTAKPVDAVQTNKIVEPKKPLNKSVFDNYNQTYNEYRNANKEYNSKKEEAVELASPLGNLFSVEGLVKSFTEPNRTLGGAITEEQAKKVIVKEKQKAFYKSSSNATTEIENQLEVIAKENGGWGKFVNNLGEADVDKVRTSVDAALEKNNIPTDSPVAYRMRNEMKAKAEFKKIEPEINAQFEAEYKKTYGVTPDEDIQKEYGLKAGQIEGVKQAKIELEKKRAIENEVLKKEFEPELEAIGNTYSLKSKELNYQIENDQEIKDYASSLQKQVIDRYQTLLNEGKITEEQANAEIQNPKTAEEINVKVLEVANQKYSKAFEGELNVYQKQLNEVNSRYNSAYRRREAARVDQANKKIDTELAKFKGTFNASKEILERRKSSYKKANDAVSKKYNLAQEKAGREMNSFEQAGKSLISGLGGGIKGYGQYFDNKIMYDIGESMEANNLIKIPESENFSDWLDVDKLVVGTGNVVGRMFPSMAVTAAVGLTTENWGTAAQMGITGVIGWTAEGMDMVGSIKGEVLEETGDPVAADNAAKSMWKSHVYSMPLYALSGVPYINGLSTKIAKKITPSLFRETVKGGRRTFLQYATQTGAAGAVAVAGELAEEIPQEFKQGIDEEVIRNGGEIRNISDQLRILKKNASWERFGKTVVQTTPSIVVMGATPVFFSETTKQAKDKYYERSVDNYVNGLSISQALETSPEQYIYNTLREKGKNFTGTLINTLYTSGNIDEKEYNRLAGKLAGMNGFQNWLKKNKVEGSETENIIGYKLHEQYQDAKTEFEAATDELSKDLLKDKMEKAKAEFQGLYKGEGTNAVILTMGDGKQFVFTPEEMNFALQFENIRAGIRDKSIGVNVFTKKGQAGFKQDTLNEIKIVFEEKPLEEGKVELEINTSPTPEKYGTVNRNDGKGIVNLTKEEFEAEQANMQPKAEGTAPVVELTEEQVANNEYISNAIDEAKNMLQKDILSEEEFIKETEGKKGKLRKGLEKLFGEGNYDEYLIQQKNRLNLLNKNPLAYYESMLAFQTKWNKQNPEDASEYNIGWYEDIIDRIKQQQATPEAIAGETIKTTTNEKANEDGEQKRGKDGEENVPKSLQGEGEDGGQQVDLKEKQVLGTEGAAEVAPIENPKVVIQGKRQGLEIFETSNYDLKADGRVTDAMGLKFDENGVSVQKDNKGNQVVHIAVDAVDVFGRAGKLQVSVIVPEGTNVNTKSIKEIVDAEVAKIKAKGNIDLQLGEVQQSDFAALKDAVVNELKNPSVAKSKVEAAPTVEAGSAGAVGDIAKESEAVDKTPTASDVESTAKQELDADKLNKEAGVDIYVARQEVESGRNKYYLSQIKENNATNTFLIEDANGNEVGKAQLSADGNYLENIRIDEKHRRKGLASKVYDFIELRKGIELEPSPNKQSKEAKALWDKRNLQKSVSNKVNGGLLA